MFNLKKTKIVATIGPATEARETLEKMALAGMNVARLNFSHGNWEEHLNRLKIIREVSDKIGKPVAILQDLCGPKIRIGDFYKESVVLKNGQNFIFTTKKCVGDEKKVFINYSNLHKEIKKDAKILLNDGKNEFKVQKIEGNDVYCKVITGGEIRGRRGAFFPGTAIKIDSLTAKDKKDAEFGIANDVDFMAVSFVRSAKDLFWLRNFLKKNNSRIGIISKLETLDAMNNIDEIMEASDGVMIARGDLAVEVSPEQVPVFQKMIIKKANMAGKPVIVATQMLESMIKNSVPTRAEVNDIANAIFDGADAVMLSEETAMGKFAVEAVEVMARTARYTEANFDYERYLNNSHAHLKTVTDSVSCSVVSVAHDISASAIVVFTESGLTARMIARHKPKQPILVLTSNKATYEKQALNSGCYGRLIPSYNDFSEVISAAKEMALKNKLVKKGDKIVISFGVPFKISGSTNLMMVQGV